MTDEARPNPTSSAAAASEQPGHPSRSSGGGEEVRRPKLNLKGAIVKTCNELRTVNTVKLLHESQQKERDKKNKTQALMELQQERDAELDKFMREVLKEEADKEAPRPWYSVRHSSSTKIRWDLVIMGFVFLSGISIPLDIAYNDILSYGFIRFLEVLDYIYLGVFVPDLLLSFFVTFLDENGVEHTDLRATGAHYIKTWFPVDALAIFPFEVINKSSGVLSLFKVLRLLRVGKVLKESNVMMTSGRGIMFRALRILLSIMLLVHWFACLWRVTARNSDPYFGMPPETEAIARRGDLGATYLFDVYIAIAMLLGEIIDVPSANLQILLSITAMLVGALVLAALFGNVAMLVASFNMSKTRLQEKMDQVNESMKSSGLPLELQSSVRQFYLYSWGRHKATSANAYIHELSPGLRSKISLFLYHDMLVSVPIFSDCNINVLIELAQAIRAHVFMPRDIIINEGHIGEEMYIIGDGQVQVRRPDGMLVAVLGKGKFFGEMALLSPDLKRQCRVEAHSICDIYELRKVDMNNIFALHPKLREDMLNVALKRKQDNEAIQSYNELRSRSDIYRRDKAISSGLRRLRARISAGGSASAASPPTTPRNAARSQAEARQESEARSKLRRRSTFSRISLVFKPRLSRMPAPSSSTTQVQPRSERVPADEGAANSSKLPVGTYPRVMPCKGAPATSSTTSTNEASQQEESVRKGTQSGKEASPPPKWKTIVRGLSIKGLTKGDSDRKSGTMRQSQNGWRHRGSSSAHMNERRSCFQNASEDRWTKPSRLSFCGTAVDDLSTIEKEDEPQTKGSTELDQLTEALRLMGSAQKAMERAIADAILRHNGDPRGRCSATCNDSNEAVTIVEGVEESTCRRSQSPS